MQLLLLIVLIILFLASYYLCGKDFFAPATMTIAGFIISAFLAWYLQYRFDYEITLETVLLIVSNLVIGVFVGCFSHFFANKYRTKPADERITPISKPVTIFALAFVILTALFIIREVNRVVGGASSYFNLMLSYRTASAYTVNLENQTSSIVKAMTYISWGLFISFAINMIVFYKKLPQSQKVLQFLILIGCILCCLLSASRFSILAYCIAVVYMWHFFRIKRFGRYKKYNIKFLFRMFVLVIIAAFFFFKVKELVGRDDQSGILDYISHYVGTSIINLDMYLKNPLHDSSIWGKETFYSFIQNLRKLGIVDIPYYYIHKEFRYINGASMGNVYTAFRDYYYDFGIIGTYFLHLLYCFISSIWYERIKMKRGNTGIIIFSLMAYTAPLYFWSAQFFGNICCMGFALKAIIAVIIYKLLLEKTLKFRRIKYRKKI